MKNLGLSQLLLFSLLFFGTGCSNKGVGGTGHSYSYNHHYKYPLIINEDGSAAPYKVIDQYQNIKPVQVGKTIITYDYNEPKKKVQFTKPRVVSPTVSVPAKRTIRQHVIERPMQQRINQQRPVFKKDPKPPHRFNTETRLNYQQRPYQARNNNYKKREITNLAKRFLGAPYVWGANGPHAYDCSSFVKKVYANHNIHLPRVSRDQAKVGKKISRQSDLSEGDLIFFSAKGTNKVKHVGIYLGNGQFIHDSSGPKKVVITSLNKPYYKKHFKWGRRLI